MAIVLGIDPGYDRLGWAIGETQKRSVTMIDYGYIQTDKKQTTPQRYQQIIKQLSALIAKHQPTQLAIENLFFSKNTSTAMQVSEVKGLIICLALENNLSIFEYGPGQIKLAVTGHGSADKQAVEKMTLLQLKIAKKKVVDDAIDALAVLLTHAVTDVVPTFDY